MRGETHRKSPEEAEKIKISIHSPHAGRDYLVWLNLAHFRPISIHSPHAGRDLL